MKNDIGTDKCMTYLCHNIELSSPLSRKNIGVMNMIIQQKK